MNSDHGKQKNNFLNAYLEDNPSWPAPSFTALLEMDYSLILGAELAAERNPTNLLQFSDPNPIAPPEMPRMHSPLITNPYNLHPLQPPDFHASPITTHPIPPVPIDLYASLLRGSLNSLPYPTTSIQLTHTTDAASQSDATSRRVFPCTLCEATFRNAQALGGHMSYHSKEKRKELFK